MKCCDFTYSIYSVGNTGMCYWSELVNAAYMPTYSVPLIYSTIEYLCMCVFLLGFCLLIVEACLWGSTHSVG